MKIKCGKLKSWKVQNAMEKSHNKVFSSPPYTYLFSSLSLCLYIYICLSISFTQRLPRNLFTAGRIQNNWIDQSHRSFDRLPRRRRLRRCRRRRRRRSSIVVVVVCEDDQIKKSQRDLVQKVKKKEEKKSISKMCEWTREKKSENSKRKAKRKVKLLKQSIK